MVKVSLLVACAAVALGCTTPRGDDILGEDAGGNGRATHDSEDGDGRVVAEAGPDATMDQGDASTSDASEEPDPFSSCTSPGTWSCAGSGTRDLVLCDDAGRRHSAGGCPGNQLCDSSDGGTQGTCRDPLPACVVNGPGGRFCEDENPVSCNADLLTATSHEPCSALTPACEEGVCVACHPGTLRCYGTVVQECTAGKAWVAASGCADASRCRGLACAGKSCDNLESSCGYDSNESCCTELLVPGGTFQRDSNAGTAATATVDDFYLDKFEVTVSRFEQFLAAYPGNRPNPGDGAHPAVPGSGWQAAWNQNLPADRDAAENELYCEDIFATYYGGYWTPDVEPLPITCVSWELAFAFCAAEGKRLPTEAEWSYAAAGGAEQRVYPWSVPANSTDIDERDVSYWSCTSCPLGIPLFVGSHPRGAGRWGHLDLSGNAWEWVRDGLSNYVTPCENCIQLSGSNHVIRGGSFGDDAEHLTSATRLGMNGVKFNISFRCARSSDAGSADAGDGG